MVDAIIAAPAQHSLTAGENGPTSAQSNLFWAYNPHLGLVLETSAGFLTTSTGNGGFSLVVGTDGSWILKFDDSTKVIGSEAGEDEIAAPPPPPAGNTVLDVPPVSEKLSPG